MDTSRRPSGPSSPVGPWGLPLAASGPVRAPIVVVLGLLVATGCTQARPRGIWDVPQVPLVLEGAPLAEPWSVLEVDESQADTDGLAAGGASRGFQAGPARY